MRKLSNSKKYGITGWLFLLPAAYTDLFYEFSPDFSGVYHFFKVRHRK